MTGGAMRGSIAIVGVAYSEVMRRSAQTIGQLAVSASDRALADAGLERSDVDGISLYPVPGGPPTGAIYDGVDYVSVEYLSQALGLENLTWSLAPANGTIAASLVGAVHALESGSCTHALVVRAMHNPQGAFGRVTQPQVSGDAQFTAPWGFGHQVIQDFFPGLLLKSLTHHPHRHLARSEPGNPDMARDRGIGIREFLPDDFCRHFDVHGSFAGRDVDDFSSNVHEFSFE